MTQQGSGYDDANYRHSSVLESTVGTYYGLAPRSLLFNHFHFADIVKFEGEENHFDEFIRVLDPEDRALNNLPYISYEVNQGGVFGQGYIKIDVGPECLSRGVRWGDVNGDGLDDFICVNPVCVQPRCSLSATGLGSANSGVGRHSLRLAESRW